MRLNENPEDELIIFLNKTFVTMCYEFSRKTKADININYNFYVITEDSNRNYIIYGFILYSGSLYGHRKAYIIPLIVTLKRCNLGRLSSLTTVKE